MEMLFTVCILVMLFYETKCERVKTEQGVLKGQREQSRGGRSYYAFYGIPYAEPPINDLRFEDPVPPKSWQGVRDATVLPSPCPAVDFSPVSGNKEDCLYLNLYTPQLNTDKLLPVIVFIYGGRFMYGHALPSRYGPQYFMDKDVVLLTFHYRLGALGFLSTEDEVMPGNYGLKDMVAVLRWIQENVQSFGGDKNRVTIAGGSSGGVSTVLLLMSPIADGLFHRCITQSGVYLRAPEQGVVKTATWKFASLIGCNNENVTTSKELKSCLKKIPAENFPITGENLYTFGHILPNFAFSPVIEKENIPGAFLVDQPSKLLRRNTKIPWLLGMNSEEGGMLTIFAYFQSDPMYAITDRLTNEYRTYFPKIFGYEHISDLGRLPEITESIKKYYFNDDIYNGAVGFSKMLTDMYLWRLKTATNLYRGPKYVYFYSHRNKDSFDKYYGNPTDEDMGVIHGDELISMFNWSEQIRPVTEGIDLVVSEQILNLWTNFATFGDPNENQEKIWMPVESSDIEYLFIKNGHLKMEKGLTKKGSEFFNNIFGSLA